MQGRSKAEAASILQRFKLFNLVSLTRVCLVVANPNWSFLSLLKYESFTPNG
jgi:hypothetical protein